ncbi:hypothetical protein AA0111_g3870 [Alternaria arborescens]|uniref:hypothetical protein n=1 Tax=Alternaria arborescens TaxID=156630 RepID=UPI001074FDD6|nr:hypothetical protein AA0111_g3870 [Alternaria arborescens]RYO33864.1 hypothetical protein AA0111_g3870 [Alternaria arborescens]
MASSVDQKRLKATKFPPEFDKKVDIEKVNIDLMKKWIANRITTILGDEDDIVVETCYNLIEQNQFPKIKEIQIQLTGFLNKDTAPFCKELWDLMLSAQDSPMGVPRELLEAKKAELQQEQLSKAAADARRAEEQAQNAMIDSFRQRDGDLPHLLASVMFTYLEGDVVVDVEDVAIDPATAVAHLRAVVLHLHHLVVHVAHYRQNPLDLHRPGVERGVLRQLAAQDLHLAVFAVALLRAASLHLQDEGGIGLRARAGGDPSILRAPVPRHSEPNRAHQRPGCDHDHEPLRAAGVVPSRAPCL